MSRWLKRLDELSQTDLAIACLMLIITLLPFAWLALIFGVMRLDVPPARDVERVAMHELLAGRPMQAYTSYAALEESDRARSRDWRNNQAACLLDRGQLDEAEQMFGDLLLEGYYHAEVGLGLVCRARGDLEGARTCLAGSSAIAELGHVLYGLGLYREAAGMYGEVAEQTGDPLFYYNLCAALEAAEEDVDYGMVAALTPESDEAFKLVLDALADDAEARGDRDEAQRARAHADELSGPELR